VPTLLRSYEYTNGVRTADPDWLVELRSYLEQFWSAALHSYMSIQADGTAIQLSIVVEAPLERAFRVFVDDFDRIKPREHNLLTVEIAETVFEAREGGRIYDRGVDGSECAWARVLAFEPPRRLVFSWDIGPTWQIETELDRTSEVEVRFIAETAERTRVELEHRNLDRHRSLHTPQTRPASMRGRRASRPAMWTTTIPTA
jgi:uncharacterized protein YndB with AHSA1/START domain